jgi:hypothetical protein
MTWRSFLVVFAYVTPRQPSLLSPLSGGHMSLTRDCPSSPPCTRPWLSAPPWRTSNPDHPLRRRWPLPLCTPWWRRSGAMGPAPTRCHLLCSILHPLAHHSPPPLLTLSTGEVKGLCWLLPPTCTADSSLSGARGEKEEQWHVGPAETMQQRLMMWRHLKNPLHQRKSPQKPPRGGRGGLNRAVSIVRGCPILDLLVGGWNKDNGYRWGLGNGLVPTYFHGLSFWTRTWI